jgi:hypothetical protein
VFLALAVPRYAPKNYCPNLVNSNQSLTTFSAVNSLGSGTGSASVQLTAKNSYVYPGMLVYGNFVGTWKNVGASKLGREERTEGQGNTGRLQL